MVSKNDVLEVTIQNQGYEGEGIAKIEDYPLFIKGAIKGERVLVKILKANKNYGFGKLIKVITASENRTEAPCQHYEKCGGCNLLHMNYETQLEFKTERVADCLRKIGGLKDIEVFPCLPMSDPFCYRNKVQLPVGEENGRRFLGFYQERSHRIVELSSCLIEGKPIEEACKVFQQWLNNYNVSVYKEEAHTGDIRHLMVRWGKATGELMLVVVTRTSKLPFKEELISLLTSKVPGLSSIIQNVNEERTNVVLGRKNKVLYGRNYIEDYIGNLKFRISPLSFFQVNPVQTKVLYDKTLEFAALTGEETVFDAYCGTGTISLFLAKNAKKVYGVEIVPEAIENAKENAKENHIDNADFIVGASEEEIPRLIKQGARADVVVVDPPRKGCDGKLLEALCLMAPKKIVYVSCDPATLARDIKYLSASGYSVDKVQPVDMFPGGAHVETVCLIERE